MQPPPASRIIMSGPTTVIFSADPVAVILAAAAIRAAQAVQEGYRQADALRDQHATDRERNIAAQSTASAANRQAWAEQIDRLEQRHARLALLSEPFGTAAALGATLPQRPDENSPPTVVAAHIEQLKARCARLEAALGEALEKSPAQIESGLDLDALSASAAAPATALPSRPATLTAARLRARLGELGPLPEEIERLGRELAGESNAERAELLELELRRAIQLFEEKAAREASAVVLEQTLKDLGYQVEAISDTLFVSGGVVHFRRPGWNDYQVRMRLNAGEKSANFNVVRAIDPGSNERSVLDHIAEDRWCAEFPALLQALAARGLHLDVTRRLEAGELPVQLVDRDKLPRFADDETIQETSAPRYKEIR